MVIKYSPILKCKLAEKEILSQLSNEDRKLIYPILEVVPRETQEVIDGKVIYTPVSQFKIIEENISYLEYALADFDMLLNIDYLDEISSAYLCRRLSTSHTLFPHKIAPLITVAELNRLGEFIDNDFSVLRQNGLGVRLFPEGSNSTEEARKVEPLIRRMNLHKNQVSIIIDCKDKVDLVNGTDDIIAALGSLSEWKTVVVVSGAAPKDLSEFSAEEVEHVERKDWQQWKNLNKKVTGINYGDYGIRGPGFKIIRSPKISPSIRYTTDDTWAIYKGKANSPMGTVQYRAHAVLLVDSPFYSGEDFSNGDKYIKSMASLEETEIKEKTSGAPRTWIQAGTDHHIHMVFKQLGHLNNVQF